jgi:hypothetical protein
MLALIRKFAATPWTGASLARLRSLGAETRAQGSNGAGSRSHLFPLIDPRGILVVDDYGDWQGARKAVDEYFRERGTSVYLHRIDYTGRILVRNGT